MVSELTFTDHFSYLFVSIGRAHPQVRPYIGHTILDIDLGSMQRHGGSHTSRRLRQQLHFLSLVSYPLSHVPCPLSLVPCPLSLVPCPLSLVPCPLSLVPCPLSLIPCLLSLVSCPLSLVPCLLSLVSCPLSLVPCPLSLIFYTSSLCIYAYPIGNMMTMFITTKDMAVYAISDCTPAILMTTAMIQSSMPDMNASFPAN